MHATHRVGYRERVHVAFGGHLLDDVEKAVQLGASGVDREENRVEAGFLGREGRVNRGFHRAIDRPAVAVLDHVIAGRDFDDNALTSAGLDHVDLGRDAASEAEDFGLQIQAGDVLNRRLVLLGNGGHAGLNPMDAQRIELLGDGHLLFPSEHDGRLLLSVAQRHVVNLELGRKGVVLGDFRQVVPGADEPFVGLPGLMHGASGQWRCRLFIEPIHGLVRLGDDR